MLEDKAGVSRYLDYGDRYETTNHSTSFVITKKGLMDAEERHGFEGDGFTYLRSPIWWGGIIALIVGEIANFAAYAFAPAILVTPLGALSVLIGAVLGSYFLEEKLGTLGKLGCAICLIGSVIIVLHAPPDKEIKRIDEILHYAIQPGFLSFCLFVAVFAVVMIYRVAPKYGKKNPLVYLSICSTVGGISVIVNPLYYVCFTTATLTASFILYGGFNTSDAVNTISLLCGFLVIFTGVYLLNVSRTDPEGNKIMSGADGIATDPLSGISTRRSMQARRSNDPHRMSMGSNGYGRGDREGLIHAYDEEENAGFGLADLGEDSDDDPLPPRAMNGKINGHGSKRSISEPSEQRRPSRSSTR
ncbi:hypothetical protein SS1G_07123 [Sclerotinia sclerotiorum 1980 UF-70]|uniref:DUF803 domain membrane protein n=1 Tax=Sclerotinia sclerotiorum (strain ATCC 18683 / 1980 / Ss-1) TaxID=665079 RepID=A7EP74_SCLS1|nr:hypothetical protein SS1G_07123 [Sclerotinia sclerotiorum 1980 UF-70]EDO04640.1 hypothetical protein SS1G_07123 [Sclerotinia sclerotiorum 1980 UF-70]